MKKQKISAELLEQIKKFQKDEMAIRTGLDHFSGKLKSHNDALWKTIGEAIPESKKWISSVDMKKEEITFLYPKKED